jgi:hypothetical protein
VLYILALPVRKFLAARSRWTYQTCAADGAFFPTANLGINRAEHRSLTQLPSARVVVAALRHLQELAQRTNRMPALHRLNLGSPLSGASEYFDWLLVPLFANSSVLFRYAGVLVCFCASFRVCRSAPTQPGRIAWGIRHSYSVRAGILN